MKIAILEWSCGGGLLGTAAGHASQGLCTEGWLMLKSLADGLVDAGLEVLVPVDLRAVPQAAVYSRAHIVDMASLAPATSDDVIRQWAEISAECDYAWVIAPEIDGLLPHILHCLRNEGRQLLNCRSDFLRNCTNKRLTADALIAAGIPHPPTTGLAEVDRAWIATTAPQHNSDDQSHLNPRWIIKPANGAGGADQRLVTREQLLQMTHRSATPPLDTSATGWIVQPWWPGQPASCTVIVDAAGKRHWLPLVSQDFKASNSTGEQASSFTQASEPATCAPQYVGCTYPCPQLPSAAPHAMLAATLDALGQGAFGPVGIDLLFNPITQTWTVIEVNARCTSSLLAMAAAYRGNLVGDIFHLLTATRNTPEAGLSGGLSPFQFRVASD